MLKTWKIEVPPLSENGTGFVGWALARSAEEALYLSGVRSATATLMQDHLWISPRRMIWENPSAR